jgi:glycosyltransferase involved in cell wall biosynthesis
MKTLHIVNDLIRGGTEGQCARVAIGLARRGGENKHRVAVFRRQGLFLGAVEAACGPVYEIPVRHVVRWSTFRAVMKLKKWILAKKFDVVHTWDAESTVFGGLAAVLAGVPLITSRRDLGEIYPRWKTLMLRWADTKAVRVVVNARAIGRHFAGQGLDESKVFFAPNVVDLEEFDRQAGACTTNGEQAKACTTSGVQAKRSPAWRRGSNDQAKACTTNGEPAKGCDEQMDGLRVVCVARMDPEKDHVCLLRAFSQFLVENEGVLVLAGDGMERKSLEKACFEMKMAEKVHFLGEKSEIPSILSKMDVGILLPRANEGLSNSILEYMAAGLPVLCTDCGGNTELVKNGENGIVVPISDEKSVFLALKSLINAEKRHKMGKNGRKMVEDSFSMHAVLDRFEALYQGIGH